MTLTLTHKYRPRGSAVSLFNCRSREVLVSGPAGTGKSRACLEKLHVLCLKHTNLSCLIVRKTLASLGSTALKTYREHVAAEAIESGIVEFYGGSAEKPPQYRYYKSDGRVGSTITIGGIDKPSKIMSSDYDVIYVQEAIELSVADWEALTTRLRNWKLSFQQIIADTNPDRPTHFLKRRESDGSLTIFESRHEENPELYDDAGELTDRGLVYMAVLERLTGVRKLRLRDGLWVAAEGVIYDEFDPAIHLIDRFEIPDSWTRWWAVDFGFTNPFVLQRWAEDPDGRLYLYAEQYQTRKLVEDHARDVLAQVCPGADAKAEPGAHGTWVEPKPRAIVCDHQASDRATLERHLGLSTVAAYKAVGTGIQAVQSRLRAAGDGRARLFRVTGQHISGRPGLAGPQLADLYGRRVSVLCVGGQQDKRGASQGIRSRYGQHSVRSSPARPGYAAGHPMDGRGIGIIFRRSCVGIGCAKSGGFSVGFLLESMVRILRKIWGIFCVRHQGKLLEKFCRFSVGQCKGNSGKNLSGFLLTDATEKMGKICEIFCCTRQQDFKEKFSEISLSGVNRKSGKFSGRIGLTPLVENQENFSKNSHCQVSRKSPGIFLQSCVAGVSTTLSKS